MSERIMYHMPNGEVSIKKVCTSARTPGRQDASSLLCAEAKLNNQANSTISATMLARYGRGGAARLKVLKGSFVSSISI